MRIGWVGLGRVGLPCALAAWQAGYDVTGYDVTDKPARVLAGELPPPHEAGMAELLADHRDGGMRPITIAASLDDLVSDIDPSGIVVIAVATPHDPMCDGTRPAPAERSDYDYTALAGAVRDLAEAAARAARPVTVAVLSTTLPGTISRVIRPLAGQWLTIVYAPAFISLGDTIAGYRKPAFLLAGCEPGAEGARGAVLAYLRSVAPGVPEIACDITTAEMAKVAFNAHRSLQIGYANWLAELCDRAGADVDPVVRAIACSLPFPAPGMPDGGACLPPGEIVITEHGPKPIEGIQAGDLVLTFDGTLQPVLRTWARNYEGELITVRSLGTLASRMTADHPVMAVKDLRSRMPNGRKPTSAFPRSDVAEVPASSLTTDHLMRWPSPGGPAAYPLPEHATPEYLELAGWFLSEGSADISDRRCRLSWTLNIREVLEAERIAELAIICAPPRTSGRGGNAKVTIQVEPATHKRTVRFGSMGLGRQLVGDFGKGAAAKRLPSWALWGDDKTAALLLQGMLKGDAYLHERGAGYTTISENLAWGSFILMTRLGCHPSITEYAARPGHARSWVVRVRNRAEAAELFAQTGISQSLAALAPPGPSSLTNQQADDIRLACAGGASQRSVAGEFGVSQSAISYLVRGKTHRGNAFRRDEWRPVRSVGRSHYEGPVHNLWVAGTNTFVTAAGATHNCRPRDLIAMSWLASDASFDLAGALIGAREAHAGWIARTAERQAALTGLPVVLLGWTYKPGTDLADGSPARLLEGYLTTPAAHWDPLSPGTVTGPDKPAVYVHCTMHPEFAAAEFPVGSVVIDPWGTIPRQPGVSVIRPGRR